jgi:hypothetical protein
MRKEEAAAAGKPLIYMIRADIDDDYVEEHHAWYARRHAPDLMAAGFWSARGYDSSTSPGLWNIYEVPDVAIFSSDAYNSGHRSDSFLETAVKKLHGRTVSLYTQLRTVDADGGDLERPPTLRGPVVASLRFDSAASPERVLAWFDERVVRAHDGVRGVRTIRLWEQRERHPKWPSTEPRWSVGIEWQSESALQEAGGRKLLEDAARSPDVNASNVKVDAVIKRYSVVREDVFGD